MVVLSGDIGGTHTRLQLVTVSVSGKTKDLVKLYYNNRDYSCFSAVIDVFLRTTKTKAAAIASACFGVAGPVVNGKVNVTNLPWIICVNDVKKRLKIDNVEIINDFMAIGYGLEVLKSKDLLTLQAGKSHINGIRAYIGAGTGLGTGFVSYHNGESIVHSTEAGHVDFAPTDATQVELLKYLQKKHRHVSLERVLSGQGLNNIYRFVCDNKILSEKENPDLHSLLKGSKNIDIAATIAEYAIRHKDNMAMRALDILIKVYGAAAGNLALSTLPFGGLYIVGGMAPKLLGQIKKGGFLKAFGNKGRMSELLKNIPLHVVLNEDIGLQGATVRAKRMVNMKNK